jgi:AcrR family transcriptional regulator
MSRTKKQSDSEVLAIAFDIIAREGFNSFTFEQVGRAVKLSPAALVKRFKNKKTLALLARNQKWDQNLGQIESDAFKKLIGLKGIFDFLQMIALSVNSRKLGEHAIFLGTEACYPHSRKKVALYFEKTRKIFHDLLVQAIKRRELSEEIDPKLLSKTLEALVQGAIFQFAFLDEKSIELHLKMHFEIMLKPYLRD